jgi:transcriptional regulator with PAS, ATPase and Fis domain
VKEPINNAAIKKRKSLNNGYIATYTFEDIIGHSMAIRQVITKAKSFAQSDFSILILGESGTGKELIAQAIHNASPRRNDPFVAINCAAVPESLLESELFGYEEGAFTGARKGGKKGLFELAHRGTVFLDEIGDLPLYLQVRLLRFLQEKTVMRIGATKVNNVNVRIISATNRDLLQMIREGKFREDLYFRLNVLPIRLPPLRERKEDIIPLINHFLKKLSNDNNNRKKQFFKSPEILMALIEYDWPGNIRELENCIAYILSLGKEILSLQDLPDHIKASLLSQNGFDDNQARLTPTNDDTNNDTTILSRAIIRILQEYKRENNQSGLGRRTITKILKKQGWNVTEHHVRVELNKLALKNIVMVNRGRAGTKLV